MTTRRLHDRAQETRAHWTHPLEVRLGKSVGTRYKARHACVAVALLVLATVLLCLVPATALGVTDGWKECGTCEWRVDDEGGLVIRPAGGAAEGELSNWGDGTPAWYSRRLSIKGVRFEGVVHATTHHSMFYGCTSLASLDVSGWDTSSVT